MQNLNLNIPKKNRSSSDEILFNHQARINAEKTSKFARVREILGGYSSAELIEILIDKCIEAYYDGQKPKPESLPKTHPDSGG